MRTKKEEIEMIVAFQSKIIAISEDCLINGALCPVVSCPKDKNRYNLECTDCWRNFLQDHIPEITIEDLTGQGRM